MSHNDKSAAASMLGKIGAHSRWAHEPDRTQATAPARKAFEARFLAEADGDPIRAAHLRKAYFARLALKSAQARRRIKEATEDATAAEAELASLGGASA